MGVTRFGVLRETDRDNARGLSAFIPDNLCTFLTGTWTRTRGAVGDYYTLHSAADEAGTIIVPINHAMLESADTPDVTKGEVALGPRINSLVPVYRLLTAAMDAAPSATLQTTVLADGAALASTNRPVTGTLGNVAHATNLNADVLTVTTPFVLDNTMECTLEITLDHAATSVFQFFGCRVNYDLLI